MHKAVLARRSDTSSLILPAPAEQELVSPSRRSFMRYAGLTAGAMLAGPLIGCGGSSRARASDSLDVIRARLTAETGFWSGVRDDFVFDKTRSFLNIGTSGSMPRQVLEFFNEENWAAARAASGGYSNLAAERARVAEGLGADPDELVFSYNTSDGMCQILLGIDWQYGDVVVTTNHEHGGANTPLAIVQDRYGVEVHRVDLPSGDSPEHTPELYEEIFDSAVRGLLVQGKRVRAMMWSSPTWLTGIMLPIPNLMNVCRRYELISIVDGAHLPGMMAYDYRELGVDFMAGAGHKWQCGPGSTGILFIRNKVRESNPLPLPKYWPVTSSSFSPAPPRWHERATQVGQEATYNIGNAVQSLGSLNLPAFRALARACDHWDEIGREKIQDYVLDLSLYLKERLAREFGPERLYSPRHRGLLSALTSFNPFTNPADITDAAKSNQFVQGLSARGFGVRNVSTPVIGSQAPHRPLRISTHLWHSVEEVDNLVDAIHEVAATI